MCMVSNISDHYRDDNFRPYQPLNPVPWPQGAPVQLPWSQDAFQLLQEIMKKMKELDEKLGLKDCEDPKKAEWMKAIEERVKRVERAVNDVP